MTYDERIASGVWEGSHLRLRSRMADYLVDGTRLGSICWPSRSGSPNDPHLDVASGELLSAALILGLLGHERVAIVSKDSNGQKLERPDLNVSFADGKSIGVEIADVIATPQAKHDAESDAVVTYIRDLLDNDPAFSAAFGNRRITVAITSPLSERQLIEGKSEGSQVRNEIEAFFRTGKHLNAKKRWEAFGSDGATLTSRGATWYANESDVPYFDMAHGRMNASELSGLVDVIRVLERHRNAAAGYRSGSTWLLLLLTDTWEFLRDTLREVEAAKLEIAPFERCYVADTSGSVLGL